MKQTLDSKSLSTMNRLSLTALFRQFISFSFVGVIATTVHYIVLGFSVHFLAINPVPASVFGFIAGAIVNYLLNYHFTFNSQKEHLETSLRFLMVALTGLGLNTFLMFLLTDGLHYLLSQVCATIIVLFWNFLCNRFWTFREANLVKE